MNQSQDARLIADINHILDSQPLDQDSRFALQKARARAMQKSSSPWRALPWLKFALSATLIAVLAINLPSKKSVPAHPAKPETVAVNNSPSKASAKPVATVAVKPTAMTATSTIKPVAVNPIVDADLLENLELYEDGEFYQWLSEQDTQGVTNA